MFSREELERIKVYKGGITNDTGIVYVYFINPLCRWLVNFYPTWIAPNLLTFLGLLCNITTFFLFWYYAGDFTSTPPLWVYPTAAALSFAYVILDNTDGKQAFRTGSSSPMGEIFDHGCDSLLVSLGIFSIASILKLTTAQIALMIGSGMCVFILPHWLEYFTHTLDCGPLNGPTEAEAFGIVLMLLPLFVETDFFTTPMTVGTVTFTPREFCCYGVVTMTSLTCLQTLAQGYSYSMKKNQSFIVILSKLLPFTISFLFGVAWVVASPELYEEHIRIFFTGMNFLFSYITIGLIVRRMCDLPPIVFEPAIIPLILASCNSVLGIYIQQKPFIDLQLVVYVIWVVYFVLFASFVLHLVNNFTSILNIRVFRIPYPNKATKNA